MLNPAGIDFISKSAHIYAKLLFDLILHALRYGTERILAFRDFPVFHPLGIFDQIRVNTFLIFLYDCLLRLRMRCGVGIDRCFLLHLCVCFRRKESRRKIPRVSNFIEYILCAHPL